MKKFNCHKLVAAAVAITSIASGLFVIQGLLQLSQFQAVSS